MELGKFDIEASRYSTIRHALKSLGLSHIASNELISLIKIVVKSFPHTASPEYDEESGLLHDKHYAVRGLIVSYLIERGLD